MGPLWRYLSTEFSTSHPWKIHLSNRVPSTGAPFLLPYKVPMDRETLSPEPLVYLIHVCLPESPRRSLLQNGEKRKVTIHGAPCRQKAYIQWGVAWFPKGIVYNTVVTPHCHAALGAIPSTIAWIDQSPVSRCVS